MQAVRFESFGPPAEVVQCVEMPDPGPPGPGEALLELVASPVNPSDLLTLSGDYGVLPALPATPGNEGVGRVVAVGDEVRRVSPGDLVLLPMGQGVWRSRIRTDAEGLFALPAEADPEQLAMLCVNPPTAYLLLHGIVGLDPGEWVIQNAANSGVGRYVITLARRAGIRTANVVRRAEVEDELTALGADAVLTDGPDLPERVEAATGGAPVRLGVDAVGGDATLHLARSLGSGATLANYGLMSGEPCRIDPKDLVFRGLHVRGFWLSNWLREASREARVGLYAELIDLIAEGILRVEIAARYPLSRIGEAVAHADRAGRGGKILLVGNGDAGEATA